MKRRNLTITVPGSGRIDADSCLRGCEMRAGNVPVRSIVESAFANADTRMLASIWGVDHRSIIAARDWVDRLILEVERKVKND